MVLRCFLCKATYKNEKDVQMHKVPKKEHIMKLWLSALNVEQINSNARLCSKHFTEQDFKISVVGEKKYLKPDAVPFMNLQKDEKNTGCSSSKEESTVEEREYIKPDAVPTISLQKNEKNTGCSSSKEESIQNTQRCNVKHTSLKRSLSMKQSFEEVPLKNIRTINDIDIKKISQTPLEAETCLEVLIEELREKRKEVKRFRDKVGKLQKTVKNLRSLTNVIVL